MVRILNVLMLWLITSILCLPVWAATPAGTRIVNQAEATYFDTLTGETITLLSNYASLVVATYAEHDLIQDNTQVAIAGQPVYFSHTLTNVGNVPDTYTLQVNNEEGDNGDISNLRLFADINSDGQVNPGEPELKTTGLIMPDQRVSIVIAGTIPNTATKNDQFKIQITSKANTNNKQHSNIDIATLKDKAVLRLNDLVDIDCNTNLMIGQRVKHEVSFSNIGTQMPSERTIQVDGVSLTGVLIEVQLSDYMDLTVNGNFTVAPITATRVVYIKQLGWTNYNNWDAKQKVDKLGVLIPATSLKPTQSGKFNYSLTVVKVPSKPVVVYGQAIVDENANGSSDFSSNNTCSTVTPEGFEDPNIDPSKIGTILGIVFDSATLEPVGNANIELVPVEENATVQVMPQASTIRSFKTSDDGAYNFEKVATGQYYLRINAPTGYIAPSVNAPSHFGSRRIGEASYGLPGFIAIGGKAEGSQKGIFTVSKDNSIVAFDIPVDRKGITGQLAIEKKASKTTVAIGDLLSYSIKVRNLSKENLHTGYIKDQLPYGFKYIQGTAKLNDKYIADPSLSLVGNEKGALLAFRLSDIAKDAELTLTYIVQVTAIAKTSDGINSAYAHADTFTNLLITSPTVKAQVTIKPEGVLSDKAILFGRLAIAPGCKIDDGKDPDKYKEKHGWPLANVKLFMEDGTYAITDPDGQYSLYGIKPGLHVIKVDTHSLPDGIVLQATDVAHAGDPDSRFVDMLPGDFQRADFTAKCPLKAPDEPKEACIEKKIDVHGKEWVTRNQPNILPPLSFESGKIEIKPEYMDKLRAIYDLATDKHNVRFAFVGHTDNMPLSAENKAKYKTNLELSKQRAYEAAAFVLQNLERPLEISIDGQGDKQPIASNDKPEGRAQNRRVEMALVYDEEVDKFSEALHARCVNYTVPGENMVGQRIMSRVKTAALGWHTELDLVDPNNANSLGNLANQASAANDGDISSGLMKAYQNKTQEVYISDEEKASVEDDEKETSMPVAKEVVKDIKQAQAKAGAWLWPLTDTSLDGRFMVVVPEGVTPRLLVNGKAVTDSHLGEQIVNKKEGAQLMAWYGVDLNEGENDIKVVAKDNFGNERTLASKTFKRPSAAVSIRMSTVGKLIADGGRSSVPVKIEVLDKNGYPAKGVYFITLETTEGEWVEPDVQDKITGHQVKVSKGERIVHLRSSSKTGQVQVRVSTGELKGETNVAQIAEMRPLIAVGLVDLRAFHNYGDGYDSVVLQQVQDSGLNGIDGRAALFMKGRVKGDKHLTFAYDSKKDPEAELLRDIDPDAYYQVYGDSSIRGYEAQSRSRLYVKVEKDRHSVMWGDYVTDNIANTADIGKVQRTLTGANAIYDDGKTKVQVFAARPDNPRTTELLDGNGTALNFKLKSSMVRNSEIIEIVTYDRTNKGLLLKVEKLERFKDYTIDEVTGYITFHRTIPSVDENNNPVSVRVSYDLENATNAYNVAGIRAQTKLNDKWTVGGSYTRDEHPTDGSDITGIYGQYKDDKTAAELGIASMSHQNGSNSGNAVRLQASHTWKEGSKTEITAIQAGAGYTNSSSGVQADRREIKITHEEKIGKNTTAKAELVNSQALSTDSKRNSAELSVTTKQKDWNIKGGMRKIQQSDGTKTDNVNTVIVGADRNIEVLGRKGTFKAEYERELGGARERAMVGADVNLGPKTKGYVRYEQADQLAGGTLAGAVDTKNNLVAGIKTELLPSTDFYSEYRLEGDVNGQDVVAVNGIKTTLELKKNLTVTPNLEVMNYMQGSGKEDSVAASVAIADTRNKAAKKLMRLETRRTKSEKYYGVNASYVAKVNENVTGMVSDQLRYTDYADKDSAIQNTLTVGGAYRPKAGGPYNALYSYKWKKDTAADENTHVLSTHQHYRVNKKTDVSGRVGAKRGSLKEGDMSVKSTSFMAAGHLQKDVTDKLGVDVHAGVMSTGDSNRRYIAGAGVHYNVMKNVRVGAGYNVSGVKDDDLDPNGTYQQGAYVGLQMKVDEDMFKWLE